MDCLICERIKQIKVGRNKFFVKELKSGYVVIGDHQYYEGYALLLSKIHTDELHKLKPEERSQFLEDMALVAEAVYKTFNPKKLNYELLGIPIHIYIGILFQDMEMIQNLRLQFGQLMEKFETQIIQFQVIHNWKR